MKEGIINNPFIALSQQLFATLTLLMLTNTSLALRKINSYNHELNFQHFFKYDIRI